MNIVGVNISIEYKALGLKSFLPESAQVTHEAQKSCDPKMLLFAAVIWQMDVIRNTEFTLSSACVREKKPSEGEHCVVTFGEIVKSIHKFLLISISELSQFNKRVLVYVFFIANTPVLKQQYFII